jgi:type II secretory pathway pseudopilin PulG
MSANRDRKKIRGFGLLETIVTVGLVSILALVASRLIVGGVSSYRLGEQEIDLQEKAASIMREFEYSARAASGVVVAKSDEFSFYRYYDLTSPSPTLVRYFVEGNQFKVGKIKPAVSGSGVNYPSESETIELLVPDVQNPNEVFSYYDDGGEELTFPVIISSISMVGLGVALDKDPVRPPVPMAESTKVNLRNLKKNL